jgi:alkylation response protein AidB-like acyl-CoA dehydrogenase
MREEAGGRLSAFLVERDTQGLSVEQPVEQLGVRAAATADLVLDEVPVPREHVLAGVGQGELIALDALVLGRVGIAAQLVGLAHGALTAAVDHVCQREQFGRKLAAFQGVQFPLAASAADLEAARALMHRAARAVEEDAPPGQQLRLAAMAKYTAATVAVRASSRAMDALGGSGVVCGSPVEKFFRDARAGTIYEGTSNILLRSIASRMFHTRGVDNG